MSPGFLGEEALGEGVGKGLRPWIEDGHERASAGRFPTILDEIPYPNRLFRTGYFDEILAGLDLVGALNGCS